MPAFRRSYSWPANVAFRPQPTAIRLCPQAFRIGRIAPNRSGCKLPRAGRYRGTKFRWMHRIRNNRRFGGWLALFALAVQLVLSFGHVHLEGIRGGADARISLITERPELPASPAQHPGNDATTIARFARPSISLRRRSCRTHHNCRCRSFHRRSSILITPLSFLSRLSEPLFNRARRQSSNLRSLLISRIPARMRRQWRRD